MLKRFIKNLRCPSCRVSPSNFTTEILRENEHSILDGVLNCRECNSIYPIDDGLLDLVVPELIDQEAYREFFARHKDKLRIQGVEIPVVSGDVTEKFGPQLQQREHFDWYASEEGQTYTEYQFTPFWTAIDTETFDRWNKTLLPDSGTIIDIGCADGRSAFQLLREDRTVIGFDVSRKMLRRAIERARELGVEHQCAFFVGDGSQIPIQDNSQEFVCTHGVLHHLPDPPNACKEIYRILKMNGVYFGSENNDSAFRGIFDFMMEVSPLWTELAGDEPLISEAKLRKWFSGMPFRLKTYTTVFLPPHVFNWFTPGVSRKLLNISDAILSKLPFMKNHGGLVVYELRRNDIRVPADLKLTRRHEERQPAAVSSS